MTTMFLIMAAIVYCVDISGFVSEFRSRVKWGRNYLSDERFDKPFFCSKCLTFWSGVVVSLFEWSIEPFLWGCLFSWFSYYFCLILYIIQDLFSYLYNYMAKRLNS